MLGLPFIGFRQFTFPCPLLPFSICVPTTFGVVPIWQNGLGPKANPRGSARISETKNSLALLPPALVKLGNVTLKVIGELGDGHVLVADAVVVDVLVVAVVVVIVVAAALPPPAVAVAGTFAVGTIKPLESAMPCWV